MGARGAGHIAAAVRVARPTVGVVTAVAAAHTELFGTDRGRGPGQGRAGRGAARRRHGRAQRRRRAGGGHGRPHDGPGAAPIGVGCGPTCGPTASGSTTSCGPRFALRTPWGDARGAAGRSGAPTRRPTPWPRPAAALALRRRPRRRGRGPAAGAALSPWRMELDRAPSGAVVLNDAYNANPTSMAAALRCPGRRCRRRAPGRPCSAPWPSWATTAAGAAPPAWPRWPTSSGIDGGRRGRAGLRRRAGGRRRRRRRWQRLGRLGAGRRRARQGQPGRRPRGRRRRPDRLSLSAVGGACSAVALQPGERTALVSLHPHVEHRVASA